MARGGGDEYEFWRICKQLGLRDSDKSHMGCPRTCADLNREQEAWKQFLSDLQTGTGSVNDSVWDLIPEADSVVEILVPLPSRSEFDEALLKMIFGKRGESDDVTVELVRFGGKDLQDAVCQVVFSNVARGR